MCFKHGTFSSTYGLAFENGFRLIFKTIDYVLKIYIQKASFFVARDDFLRSLIFFSLRFDTLKIASFDARLEAETAISWLASKSFR